MEKILVLNYGGSYSRITALRIRENNVFSEIKDASTPIEDIKSAGYKGIIITGPKDFDFENISDNEKAIFELGIPVLGIDFGAKLMAVSFGGELKKDGDICGSYNYALDSGSPIFSSVNSKSAFFMDITDHIAAQPIDFKITAKSAICRIAAIENSAKRLYGVQFHPEKTVEPQGNAVIKNFLFEVCGCHREWTTTSFVLKSVKALKEKLEGKSVLCALSGGVNSAVAAMLLHRAAGSRLTCLFIDHGFHRKGEAEFVKELFGEKYGIKLLCIDAKERFAGQLKGISAPNQKLQIIEKEFARIFEDQISAIGNINFFVNGAIYTDILDPKTALSGFGSAEIIEPLRSLFKPEVRRVGLELGLPEEVIKRQAFPKTGLALRVSGNITEEKLSLLREADAILRKEIAKAGAIKALEFCYVSLCENPFSEGNAAAYNAIIRTVTTSDYMLSSPARIAHELYESVSKKITANIKGFSKVLYDITFSEYDRE